MSNSKDPWYPGYIILAINFADGIQSTFRIGTNMAQPDSERMRGLIFRGTSDTIEFYGRALSTSDKGEDCYFRVPRNGYLYASWEWYSFEEVEKVKAEAIEAAEKLRAQHGPRLGSPEGVYH